ncbi:hAT transposon superfamily [Euphorbia peplus]|nr:hAT transposon superfamily [Euphorbia peplus]
MPSESDKWGWEHVSVFGGFDRGSGTKRWKCNHCKVKYNGSYSRVRAHLLGFSGVGVKSCPAIDRSIREGFQILEEERLARKKKKNSVNGKPVKRTRTPHASLSWKTFAKDDVDDIVARFFYADGLNLDIVNSPYFHEMVQAIGAFGSGYEPPSIDKLSDSFLSKEKGRIEKSMAVVKESWPHTGCTILCVGQLNGMIGNFNINMFVSSPRGLTFLKSIDIDDNDEGDHLFSGALSDAILEVGSSNVIQIISHLGGTCKSSESVILSKFPHIFWSPCTLHSILMLMEAIAELEWIKRVVLCAKAIEQCITTYQHISSCIFVQSPKESLKSINAKFSPSYHSVQRIFELRQVLEEVVVSDEWKQWKQSTVEEAESIESAVLGDEFWSKAHLMLQLYEPFIQSLTMLDAGRSPMGFAYDWRIQALETLRNKAIDDGIFSQLEALIDQKWDMLFSPLHATGYILNPRYMGKSHTKDKSVMRGWKATLERYKSDSTERRVLREELSAYWRLEGSLGEEDAVDCRDKMDPVAWWENFGFETPNLQTLAIKVLSQVSSAAMCQDICQTNDFSRREAANQLDVQRAEDLLFVQNNLRLNCQRNNGNFSSSPRQRNVVSSSSGVRAWDRSYFDQMNAIVNIHDNL